MRLSRLKTTTTARIAYTAAMRCSFRLAFTWVYACSDPRPARPSLEKTYVSRPSLPDILAHAAFRDARRAGCCGGWRGRVCCCCATPIRRAGISPAAGSKAARPARWRSRASLRKRRGSGRREAFELVSVHANHAFFPNDHVLVYRITAWTQGEATQKGEIAEVRFVDPLNPPPEVSAGTKRRLDELFAGKPRSELW